MPLVAPAVDPAKNKKEYIKCDLELIGRYLFLEGLYKIEFTVIFVCWSRLLVTPQ
jgi:hypothetical protein